MHAGRLDAKPRVLTLGNVWMCAFSFGWWKTYYS